MPNLLEDLLVCSKCNYISDLHQAHYASLVRMAVQDIDADAYPAAAWNDAASYITQQKQSFATAEEAIAYLLSYLED